MIVFDIETAPLPEERLRQLCEPFDPGSLKIDPALMLPFDQATVKYGNCKDPQKRAEKLAEAQARHEAEAAVAKAKLATGEAAHWTDFVGRAALSATTGHVAAIGYHDPSREPPAKIVSVFDADTDERRVIAGFWNLFCRCRESRGSLVGHNIHGFDLPFLLRRSWILGVAVPAGVLERDRYWSDTFCDTMSRWRCGGSYSDNISLDRLARTFGCGQKPDDCTGADFARLFYSPAPEDRDRAERYLLNDLEMTAQVAFRLGIA